MTQIEAEETIRVEKLVQEEHIRLRRVNEEKK